MTQSTNAKSPERILAFHAPEVGEDNPQCSIVAGQTTKDRSMTNTKAPERIWTCEHVGEYGHYFPEAVEAEGEYGGTAVEYILADLAPQWQDIATAPKDDLIDIWLKDGVRWCDCYYDRICSEWRTSRPSGHLVRINESHVTHWMPLPTPPEPK
jgi:hypothetical protein